MNVCPVCGYVDPPCWRHPGRGSIDIDVCRIDELDIWQPELAKELRERGETFWGGHAYRLFASGYVRRKLKALWDLQGWDVMPAESVDPRTGLSRVRSRMLRKKREVIEKAPRSQILTRINEFARLGVGRKT